MGYTHYYNQSKPFEDTQWNAFVEDVQKLLNNLPLHSHSSGDFYSNQPLVVRGAFGAGKPDLSDEHIAFNGDEKNDLGHETCLIEKNGEGFNFCKTARKPYDLLVQATYLLASYYNDGITLSSDGEKSEWKEAIDFAEKVTGNTLSHLI